MSNKIEFLKPGRRYKFIGENCGYFRKGKIYETPPDEFKGLCNNFWSYIQTEPSVGERTFKGKMLNGFGPGYIFDDNKRFKDVFIDVTSKGHLPKWL